MRRDATGHERRTAKAAVRGHSGFAELAPLLAFGLSALFTAALLVGLVP